jgi:hypothetical protein
MTCPPDPQAAAIAAFSTTSFRDYDTGAWVMARWRHGTAKGTGGPHAGPRTEGFMTRELRLSEDVLCGGSTVALPALPRMVFVVHGAVTIDGRTFAAGTAWHGQGEVTIAAAQEGADCWRWDLAAAGGGSTGGSGVVSREKLVARLDTLPAGDLLFRGDSVAFPPGGCAYLHRHQGPGIRCLIEGGIRIDTHGRSTSYGPGGAWYESGPEPVFAQAALDRPSRFIRVMILPRALLRKSSIEYLNEDDKTKPRSQQYQVFVDAPIELPQRI